MSLTRVQDVAVQDIHKRKKPRKHYVYVIHVQWQDGPIIPVYRSYYTLLELQEQLIQNQKGEDISTITLKGKRFSDRFTIKKRTKAIRRMSVVEEFLKSVVHLPSHISESDAVTTFFLPLPEDLIEIDYEEKDMHHSTDDLRRASQKPKNRHIHHISEPVLVEQYVVICDYVKEDKSAISLKSGNVVDVIEKYEHGWWFVDLDGEVGWAPASFLEPRDGSEDDQVLEVFEEGEEETYITMAAYEPQLEDEVKFDMGKIVKVIQKNLDGWWLIKFDDQKGWAPSMFMREIATSRYNAREKGKHNARALFRDRTRKYITSGRRKTWDPPQRKRSVKRTNPGYGTSQTESSRPAATPTYVNLKFHEATKSDVPGKGRTGGKLDADEVRASARLQPIDETKNNTENTYENSIELSKPRPLSLVTEEGPETVSRGTTPIPSPLLVPQDSNTSSTPSNDDVLRPIPSSEFPYTETSDNTPFMEDNKEPDPESNPAHDINDPENATAKDKQDISDEGEGDEYTENMPELVNNSRFYAMGSYKKQDEEEVNLRENAEVEVLEEDSGGWWLVRTSSHSVGWAPSNFLEKVQSLRRVEDNSAEDEWPVENNYHDNLPTRPPKSPRVQKMARDMCIEKNFWNYMRKGKDAETCPINPQEMSESSSEVDTGNYQPAVEVKGNESEVMVFTFDDYECDPDSGVCFTKGRKKDGMKYFPSNKIVAHDKEINILEENNNIMERSESVPSLAEPEDFDDHDYEFIEL